MDETHSYVEQLDPDQGDYSGLVHFLRHRVQPPSGVYITVDDAILFQGWSALAATSVQLSIRTLTPEGVVVPEFFIVNVLANGVTPTTKLIPGREGFLLSMSCRVLSGLAGAVFVTTQIQRGQGSSDQTQGQQLLQGYPSLTDILAWPIENPAKSIDQRALANVITAANPAAGADYSIVVPAGVNWMLRSIRLQLVTAVAVANRFVTLRLDDGLGNIFADLPAGAAQAASLTQTYTWLNGATNVQTNLANLGPLPTECRMAGTWRIRTNTINLQAADQFSGLAMEIETFIAQ